MDYNFDVADKTLFVTRGANMLHVASIRVSSPLAKAINSLRQRIAALEAEKAERERIISQCAQAVGAFVSPECSDEFRAMLPAEIRGRIDRLERERDALRAERTERECSDAKRAETSLRPLYAAPPVPRVEQEPVAWVLFDDIFIASKDMSDDPPNLECMKPLYAHPLALREPTEKEYSRIAIEAGHRLKTEAARIAIGRTMWQAVRKGMTK